ncbi:hypothetical protein F947_00505 [Acinetobacter towneri DSM 14962 = CIP 107472]|jgi:hypothetical protein|nr:hypothetical protein F947_00505 [Acinetobacter towneri DSM 14962 = CIP 107472]
MNGYDDMETTKLASAYSRTISGKSNAWVAFPEEKNVCEFSEPLCNNIIKVRNYYVTRPYNFMMNLDQWSSITNKIELLTAIRFGMEWDTNNFPEGYLSDPAFHTQMYIKFHKYLMKNVMREAPKIVAEFQKAVFKARFLMTFTIDEVKDIPHLKTHDQLQSALMKAKNLQNQIDKINVIDATRDMFLIQNNRGPITINRNMFIDVFKQDFNPHMIQILKSQGIYLGDPDNVLYKKIHNTP